MYVNISPNDPIPRRASYTMSQHGIVGGIVYAGHLREADDGVGCVLDEVVVKPCAALHPFLSLRANWAVHTYIRVLVEIMGLIIMITH
jgi:hypothetical protein